MSRLSPRKPKNLPAADDMGWLEAGPVAVAGVAAAAVVGTSALGETAFVEPAVDEVERNAGVH